MDEKEPELNDFGQPNWFHMHGTKMRLQKDECIEGRLVVIKGSAAEVRIIASPIEGWFIVEWRLDHPLHTETSGRAFFDDSELAAAFGLLDNFGSSEWLIDRFGGTVAKKCKFIRWKDFLNIAGPGTGLGGDPNVSIRLNEEIKNAIRGLHH